MIKKIFLSTILHAASFSSLLAMYIWAVEKKFQWPWLPWALYTCVAAFALAMYFEIFAAVRAAPKRYRDQNKINKFMCEWVGQPGRTVILTRDMSWAPSVETMKRLKQKANSGDLVILIRQENHTIKELQASGAQIISYDALGHIPLSRFTIVGFGRDGARVAVGRQAGGYHVIETFESGAHPIFAVADDLVRFIMRSQGVAP